MSVKVKKGLMERWSTELDFGINRGLKKESWKDKDAPNIRWSNQPFGLTEDGKIDFRGFPFREMLKYQNIINIDFSYSLFIGEITDGYGMSRGDSGIIDSIFECCNFIGSKLPANLTEKFTDCDFSCAIFESTRVNGIFDRCIFFNSKMKDVIGAIKFINCDFTKASLSKSAFNSSYFENCIFEDTKFSGANISGCTFIGTRPSDTQIASCSLAEKVKYL